MSGSQGLLDNIDIIIDEKIGIVRYAIDIGRIPGEPTLFHYYASACNTQALAKQWNFAYGGGASVNKKTALAKSVGECIERYCAAIYDLTALNFSSYKEADFPCVHPSEFALFSKEQYESPSFPWKPFTEETQVRWVIGYDLINETPCGVPACMVYIPYQFSIKLKDTPIVQPISTGLACHSTPCDAMISAICEVIERDAFTILWQRSLSPPIIEYDSLPEKVQDLVHRFTVTGSTVSLFDITLDHKVPTILSVQTNNIPTRPALTVATSCSPSPTEAAVKSLEELAHTYHYMVKMNQLERSGNNILTTEQVINQESHMRYWCDHRHINQADFLFNGNRRISFDNITRISGDSREEMLSTIIKKIENVGNRVIVCDLTTPDVRELGLTVVRALIPGFNPLLMGHNNRALGGTRLWTVPEKIGYSRISSDRVDNPIPHPFP
jgi:ribosomal protein S12 methylthiotransferase accessory factor